MNVGSAFRSPSLLQLLESDAEQEKLRLQCHLRLERGEGRGGGEGGQKGIKPGVVVVLNVRVLFPDQGRLHASFPATADTSV